MPISRERHKGEEGMVPIGRLGRREGAERERERERQTDRQIDRQTHR